VDSFAIRRLHDASRIEELLALVHGAFRDLPIDPPSSVLKEAAADFAARLKTDTCFVVEADGTFVGSVFCTPEQDALYIGRLAVRADWRRRGVANALVAAAKAEARRIGAKRMTLGCRIALAGNLALFRRHGFIVVAQTCHAGFTTPTSYDMELQLG
jgi:predicted N-acetyltransferase YhbS